MTGTVAEMVGAGKRTLRRALAHLAPAGTRRRSLVDRALLLGRHGAMLPLLPPDRTRDPWPDLADRQALATFLEPFGVHLPANLNAADPGRSVWHWYDHHLLARQAFPLAATPCERGPLLTWLLTNRVRLRLAADDILAFFLAMHSRSDCGLAALYRRHPEWQHAVPDALTDSGWERLRRWIADRYHIRGRWLDEAILHAPGETNTGPGVNLLGHFCYPSGLEVAARNTVRALESVGWATSCRDVPTGDDQPGREEYLGLHPFPVTISQLAPEPFGPESYELAGLARRRDTYRIGYWYWELEAVPARWRSRASWLDEIWAPTRFVADALRGALSLPVVPMLPGIAPPPKVWLPRSRFGLPEDRFVFLTMFDMASSFERKNPLAAVAAFRRAFPADAPVTLAIKVTRGHEDPAALEDLRGVSEPGRILLLEEMLSANDLAGLHATCDAHVSLHRSEGFGLALAEAMALAKPVIATGYSGNLDFMDASNSLLVSFRKVPVRTRRGVYPAIGEWAEPSVEHAAELMRRVVSDRAWAHQVGQRAAVRVHEQLCPEAAGRRMTARLDAIGSLQQIAFAIPRGAKA